MRTAIRGMLIIFGVLIILVAAYWINFSVTAANKINSATGSCAKAEKMYSEVTQLLEQEIKAKAENKVLSSDEQRKREKEIEIKTTGLTAYRNSCAENRRWFNISRYPSIAAAFVGALMIFGGWLIGRR